MADRSIQTIIHAAPQPGTGILHPFPTAELAHLDPFVFLDTGAPKHLQGGEIYVGPHPHRGVQPVSLVFRARIEHRDSLGNHKIVTSGGMQWLVAGSGALHEEILSGDEDGIFHMAQLWVNVPAADKMAPPEHHAATAEEVPLLTDLADGVSVRLFAGDLAGRSGPAPLGTPVLIAHIVLEADTQLQIPLPPAWNTGLCVVAGTVTLPGADELEVGATPVFAHDCDTITISSKQGGEVLLMSGEPIGEPIAMGGGFVMNRNEEVAQAFDDYNSGRLGDLKPTR